MGDSAPLGAAPGRVTIAEVATRAGVSPTTVSHVLSGKRVVGAATKSTVLEAIQELGYRPNHVARNLRTRQSHMIAVVVPDLTDPFYAVLTRGLADAVDAAGYGTYVCNTDGLHEREVRFFQDVQDRGVDGIVLASGDTASAIEFGPTDHGTPIVCVGDRLEHPHSDSVLPDEERGAFDAAGYLVGRGYQRIAMIQGPAGSSDARTRGFTHALQEAGRAVPEAMLARGDGTRAAAAEQMDGLLSLPEPPDAVFCANDLMAVGALDAARRRGLEVPRDVAVMGFDDVDAATVVAPPLTTVRNPAYETGRAAGDLLISRMTGQHRDTARTVLLPCPVVPRESA